MNADIKTFLTSFNHMAIVSNFQRTAFYGDCKQWETIRDMVEARFPDLDMEAQGALIGKLMARLKR